MVARTFGIDRNVDIKSLSPYVLVFSVADYASADCKITLSGAHDRTLVVGPSNANKCGGELFPWRLRVDAGQRVNVTLVQLAVNLDDDDNDEEDLDDSTLSDASMEDQYDVIDDTEDAALSPVLPHAMPVQNGRKSWGINTRETGDEYPEFGVGNANANCPPDFFMFQNSKHRIACITMQ